MSTKNTQAATAASVATSAIKRVAFSTSRLLDFCSEKELSKLVAHEIGEWPLVVVKELVDNALDACEGARISPVIEIVVDDGGITVSDNGPGMPPETVKALLNYIERTSSREAYVSLSRGAQGNAMQTIFAMPFVLNGERGHVRIEAKGLRHDIEFSADHIQRKPVINYNPVEVDVRIGTTIWVEWPLSPRSELRTVSAQFLQIVSSFAWLNPHLTLTLNWYGNVTAFTPTDRSWSKWLPSDASPPHWYEVEHLERLIGAYIAESRQTGKEKTVREFISEFGGLSGTAKQSAVLAATGMKRETLSRLVKGNGFDRPLVTQLLEAMREAGKEVKPASLGVIGESHLRQRFDEAGCEMSTFKYKKLLLDGGLPTVVEVAFAWRPEDHCSQQDEAGVGSDDEDANEDEVEHEYDDDEASNSGGRLLVTGVNSSPGTRSPFSNLKGQSLDGLLAEQWASSDSPVVVFVHLSRPRVQYTDLGKSKITLPPILATGIVDLITSVTKTWAKDCSATYRSINAKAKLKERMTRKLSTKATQKAAAYEILEAAYLKASANGAYPALARQIMYAARPHIQEVSGAPLSDKYFTQTLLPNYIEEKNVKWNVVYDARGRLHEPHTGLAVPLGTLDIRSYLGDIGDHVVAAPNFDIRDALYPTQGPKNRYGAIMFIEKEGFMPLFKAVKLAERYDIAIMSTKGMSVVACRQLVDTLCADRNIPLLVVHDFDKSGFSIAGTLRQPTRRYKFANDINVIDVGMRIGDIAGLANEASGLKPESAAKHRLNLARNGATPDEIEYLLKHRVELNAFTSDAFVDWIEGKLAQHGVKKVIPDDATLAAAFARADEQEQIQALIETALKMRRAESVKAAPADLRARVEQALLADPRLTWDGVVAHVAARSLGKRQL
jgi:DNA topoisomerase VI subunit B